MKIIRQEHVLAEMLSRLSIFHAASTISLWGDRDYHIFTEVPVHCLSFPGAEDIVQEFPNSVIDLLICRGNEVVLAVEFGAEALGMDKLFSMHLKGVSCVFPDRLEFSANSDTARTLCRDIEFQLRCDRSDPQHTGCRLYCTHLLPAILSMKEPAIDEGLQSGFFAYLKKKQLLLPNGSISGYGQACGVFRHWPYGRSMTLPVTTMQSRDKVKQALLWRDASDTNLSLENRLLRLKLGLPSDAAKQEAATLKRLLDIPLDLLFQTHPKDRATLNAWLAQMQAYPRKSGAFPDIEQIKTYGDVISAVKALWEEANFTDYSDDHLFGAMKTCGEILAYLSFPLWSMPVSDETSDEEPLPDSGKPQSLQEHLGKLRSDLFDYALAGMPITHYFYAAACLTESEYPLWLYRVGENSLYTVLGEGKLRFCQAMHKIYTLGDSKPEEYYDLLYDILVKPFSGII